MQRNSMRSYWMANKDWYKIVDGKFELTPEAPPVARRSFAEWHKPRKMTFRRLLLKIRALFY
ncbi:MAG: hypothetical protein J6B96_03925 [Agathobacter sp.]|nr:hypothetical protein [Agathobacter sp.]